MPLHLRTFGGLTLLDGRDGSTAVPLARKAMATLALLVDAGPTGLSRDRLVALLWPESDESRGRNALRQTLHVIRSSLNGSDPLEGTAVIAVKRESLTSDIGDFQQAIQAKDDAEAGRLYQGSFLESVYLSGAPEFERWAEERRRELAQEARQVFERLARKASAGGEHLAAVRWLRRMWQDDPLDPRVSASLVHALAAAGDVASAIEQARIYQTARQEELGLEPDAALEAFIADLHRSSTPADLVVPRSVETNPNVPVAVPVSRSPSVSRRRYYAIASLASALVLAAAFFARPRHEVPAGEVRLALMPFENLGVSSDGYFVRGLSEEIRTRLAGVSGLDVVTHSVSDSNSSAAHTLNVGRELGVHYLLTGGVRWEREGDNPALVRVTPRLLRVSDGRALWGEGFESDLQNVFELQERIAERVARALDLTMDPAGSRASVPPTRNPDAYVLYLQANDFRIRPYFDPRDTESAARLYRRAIELDPHFAEAYAGLSATHQEAIWRGHNTSAEYIEVARVAAESAVALQPGLGVTHLVLGRYYGGVLFDLERGLHELRLAARLSPNDPTILEILGGAERRMGLYWDAAEHLSRASLLNPQSSNAALAAGLTLAIVRQYSSAERWIDRAIMLAPDWGLPYAAKAQLYLAWRGDTIAARNVIYDALPTAPLADIMGHLGYAEDVGFSLFLVATDPRLKKAAQTLTAGDFRRFAADTGMYWLTRAYLCRMDGRSGCARAYSDSAARFLRTRVTEWPQDNPILVQLGIALAGSGQREAALRMADRALALLPLERDVVGAADRGPALAQLYLLAGVPDRAVAELERLLHGPSALSPQELRVNPTWKPLRSDPRFEALLRSGNPHTPVASRE
jgi:DNA-binding SARP family transcriptional activator/TolB-like protein/Flp pilus assembly protein TadD